MMEGRLAGFGLRQMLLSSLVAQTKVRSARYLLRRLFRSGFAAMPEVCLRAPDIRRRRFYWREYHVCLALRLKGLCSTSGDHPKSAPQCTSPQQFDGHWSLSAGSSLPCPHGDLLRRLLRLRLAAVSALSNTGQVRFGKLAGGSASGVDCGTLAGVQLNSICHTQTQT